MKVTIAAAVIGALTGCGWGNVDSVSTDAAAEAVYVVPVDATGGGSDDASVGSAAETGTSGADGGADVVLSCAPQAVPIPAFVPPRAPRTACTDTQIQSFYDDCFSSTWTATACNAFKGDPDNSPCVLCMESSSTEGAWGPIIDFSDSDTIQANIGGCIAMLDQDASAGSCAAAVQADYLCKHLSCASTCPNGSTTAGLAAFDGCEGAANLGVCQAYEVALQCDQAPRYVPCLFANFEAYFRGLGRVFCNPQPNWGADAGAADAGGSDANAGDDGAVADAASGD